MSAQILHSRRHHARLAARFALLVAFALGAGVIAAVPGSPHSSPPPVPPPEPKAAAHSAGQAAPAHARPLDESTCLTCHADKEAYKADVHAQKGFGCEACHGGDPADADMSAMSKAKGFRGKPARTAVPDFCGRCHSDAAFMKNYAPQMRVDQVAQYRTSVHGRKLAAGQTNVATCIDCHGVHGIRPAKDPRSSTFPVNQPETCGHCHHATEQKDYQQSVHWELLSKKRELAAPACASCHGNHGATPPNVNSTARVCGTCHAFFEELFQKSPHAAAFEAAGLRGCVECHSNHHIARVSDSMIGDGAKAVCRNCHSDGDRGLEIARSMAAQLKATQQKLDDADRSVHQAEVLGMEVSDARMEVSAANQALVQARVLVHGLDLKGFGEQTQKGAKAADAARQQGADALRERDFRRKGLLVSIGTILLTMVGLYLTIKTMERK